MSSLAVTLLAPALLALIAAALFAYCIRKAQLVREDVAMIGSLLERVPQSLRDAGDPGVHTREADQIDSGSQATGREYRI